MSKEELDLAAAVVPGLSERVKLLYPEPGDEDARITEEMREAFRTAAGEKFHPRMGTDGDLDLDVDAFVSDSEDGAYVMGWLWVTNAEAGLNDPDEEDEEDGE